MSTTGLGKLMQENPAEAKRLMSALSGKLIIPHEGGQQAIMENKARFQVVCCGRRFGKTVIGAKKALARTRQRNQMVWWVAPTYRIVKRGYREVLRQLPDGVLERPAPSDSSFDAGRAVVLRFKNGSRMEFHSAERPEGMLGEGVDYVVLDEASKMPPAVWEQTIRPTLMDRQGGALMISTPTGRNWFYYLWLRGQDEDWRDYASWQFPTSANPHVAEEEIDEMRASLPLLVYQQEVLAEFIASAGTVFRYNPEVIVPKGRPQGHVVVGVDLAKSTDFTVFYAANAEDGQPCGYDRYNEVSWPLQRTRLKGFVTKLLKAGATHVTLVMDSTGVGDPIVEDMEMAGYDVVPVNFTKTKQHMVVQLSKDLEDGYVRLLDERLEEFENYAYTITPNGKFTYSAPEGQHDDVVSAKMLQHWGLVQEGAPNITALTADDDVSSRDTGEPLNEDEAALEGDDWSDLLDEDYAVDTGRPQIQHVKADSTATIMARPDAWS